MKTLPFILIFIVCLLSPCRVNQISACLICQACIGYLDVKDGSVVYEFTTPPGSKGLPKTKVGVITGVRQVFEIYDWAEKYKELKGQKGHKWYRTDWKKGYWTWGAPGFTFKKKTDGKPFGEDPIDAN